MSEVRGPGSALGPSRASRVCSTAMQCHAQRLPSKWRPGLGLQVMLDSQSGRCFAGLFNSVNRPSLKSSEMERRLTPSRSRFLKKSSSSAFTQIMVGLCYSCVLLVLNFARLLMRESIHGSLIADRIWLANHTCYHDHLAKLHSTAQLIFTASVRDKMRSLHMSTRLSLTTDVTVSGDDTDMCSHCSPICAGWANPCILSVLCIRCRLKGNETMY